MSDILKIETTYIPHLRSQFSSGSLVLLTGAGFSLEAINTSGSKLPSTLALTELLYGLCYPGEDFETDTQLQDIFQQALAQHRRELGGLLRKLFTVDGEKSPDWYKEIISMPWLRAYTLNIDDLLEKSLETVATTRNANCISAITDPTSKITDTHLDVIHLNGTLADAPDNVIFSREQYAERIGKDPFYQQLNSDLLSRPVVFIGTSLEEGTMWAHMISRGPKGVRTANELRPRSYLVLPHLNKSKQSLLAKYNIVWLKMSGETFCKKIISNLEDSKLTGFKALNRRGLVGSTRMSSIKVVSEYLQEKVTHTEYLLGQEPTWSDFQNESVAIRECFHRIWVDLNKIRASTTPSNEILLLTGTAGVGKSSALMWAALKLHADGVEVGWVDSENKLTYKEIIDSVNRIEEIGALFINDADIYGSQLSSILRTLLDQHSRLLIVIEARSNKIDRIINQHELGSIAINEITIPNLCDSDIDRIISVLDKENRLGQLKGKSDRQRKEAFRGSASRQLLVAMYEATSGRKFAERAEDELSDLTGLSKQVYGLLSTASAFRFSLTRDELLIACGDANNEALNIIETLGARKLIHVASAINNSYRARHRVIAQISYNCLVTTGQFEPILRGLIMIGVAKVSAESDRNSRPARILRTFINHNFMTRAITPDAARNIYGEFENALSWDSHYWLHRGALELETNHLDLAENFLNQAMSLRADDPFIENEWAYLLFKKAIATQDINSKDLIDEAIKTLESIIIRRVSQSAHAYHVLGFQGLKWAELGILSESEKLDFLTLLKAKIHEAVKLHPRDNKLENLFSSIQKSILQLAVKQ